MTKYRRYTKKCIYVKIIIKEVFNFRGSFVDKENDGEEY